MDDLDIEAEIITVNGEQVLGRRAFIQLTGAASVPDDPPATDPDIKAAIEDVLVNAPVAEGEVDPRDLVPTISNGELVNTRWRSAPIAGTPSEPGTAPVVNTTMGTRGTVYLPDEGAKPGDRDSCRKAMASAVKKVGDGGKVFIPYGRWPMNDIAMPGNKDYVIEGETELGAEIFGSAGRDVLVWSTAGTQRRLQNRPIIRNLRFGMPGNGQRGSFNRKTTLGWNAGAACLAWVAGDPGDKRKGYWGNSYVTLQNVTAWGDKDALGACLLYSDRPLYGLRATDIYVGHHGNDVSGLHGGFVFGKPPADVMEATSDEMRIERFVHWGGQCSIAAYNVANGAVVDHKAYNCRYSLHLTGHQEQGPRKHCREIDLRELYYDCEMSAFGASDGELIHINSEGCEFSQIHIKGQRAGDRSPRVKIRGEDVRGGQIRIMSSTRHASPTFDIAGEGHEFYIRAAGVPDAHKSKMVNGGRGYAGVTVR